MAKILVVGTAVLDHVFFVDAFPTEAAKYKALDATVAGGGCAANAAVAIARLGGGPMLASRLGGDSVGDLIVAGLAEEGVNVELCDRSGERSAYSSILIDHAGERQIVSFRGSALSDASDHITSVSDVGAVLSDTRWTAGCVAAMERAAALNVPGVLDIEASDSSDAFAAASHLAFSLQGLSYYYPGLSSADALAQVQKEFGGWACVTLGEDGVLYHGETGPGHIKGFQVDAIDTLGAGDIWHGAFTLALAEGQDEISAARFANAAGAIKCTRRGGRAGAPNRAETEQFMKERG